MVKVLGTRRRVKLFDKNGNVWNEIDVPVSVLGGKLPAVVAMGDKIFLRDGEELHECRDLYRAPLPYLVGF